MKNEYKITKDLIKSWAGEYPLYGAVNILLFLVWCIAGILGITGLILSTVLGLDRWVTWLYVLITLIALYRLFVWRYVLWAKRYKIYADTYGVTEWIRTVEFTDEEIILTDHTSVNRFRYSNIRKIKEKGNLVILLMQHNLVLRLYKDAFSEGSWEECEEKLHSACRR